ncbi:MAG: alginate export family protein [Bryobacteraceae bacterium]|nr:alginate export family protein [Bryobacteraceae bacterium]
MLRYLAISMVWFLPGLAGQTDPGRELNRELAKRTAGQLELRFELRQRAESRTGAVFGRDRDLAADYVRTRVGLTYKPFTWLKTSVLGQDSRAPFYGAVAPGNVRDPLDLQEAYVEIFQKSQRGFGFTGGRQMVNYGDTRLIGSPQWAYTARTWDTARIYYVTQKARFEFLTLSPIVPRSDRFNRPVLGDRIWGTYHTFRDLFGKTVMDAYVLRHDQNYPGGFAGPGTLGVNLYGTRWAIPLPDNFRLTLEGILQNGKVGRLAHRAGGGVAQLGYRTAISKRPLDFANEYKYASGSDPRSGRSGTFDQLYPAAHDKFGHVDLLGWRNVHNVKSATTFNLTKSWNWVLMYNSSWLANPRDAVYNGQGRAIVRASAGNAGRYIGQEVDLYSNYQRGSFTISSGIGQFFPGGFIRRTTPGARSRLIYLSTSYSF